MKLVVFDLDGTLTRTSVVDAECYAQAILETASIEGLNTDWTGYKHATDEGILRQIFLERFGCPPGRWERARICDRFIDLLAERCARNAGEFSEVPGAGALVRRLLDGAGWGVAIATGAWRRSATFKIQHSGLPVANLPSAFAEDGSARETVVRAAIQRAHRHYHRPAFERIVSVGDGLWDVSAARSLGLPFLGIAEESYACVLRENGASHVLENYLDATRCLQSLDEARPPARVGPRARTEAR
jgi:phosphoglycolate phosphatase-like HAD superfamily hydrolase